MSVKGTIHWVSIPHAIPAQINLYDRLLKAEDPSSEEGDFKEYLHADSLQVITGYVEPSLQNAGVADRYQFIRKGYFCVDKETANGKLVFNRTVTLKDAWSKGAGKN